MNKNCPACGNTFICQEDNILECDCIRISLSQQDIKYLGEIYEGCLCTSCLGKIKEKSKNNEKIIA